MADNDDTPADGGQDPALASRVASLEDGQQGLADKLDKVLGMLGGGGDAPAGGAQGAGDAGGISREISAQLEQQRARDAAAAAEHDRDGRLRALETTVTEMREKAPGPLPTRRARAMWGKE